MAASLAALLAAASVAWHPSPQRALADGCRLLVQGKFEAALVAFDEAARAFPRRAVAVAGRGTARLLMGQAEAAEADFRAARDLGAGDWILACMAGAKAQAGAWQSAAEHLRAYLRSHPADRRAGAALALCLAAAGDAQAAQQQLASAGDCLASHAAALLVALKQGGDLRGRWGLLKPQRPVCPWGGNVVRLLSWQPRRAQAPEAAKSATQPPTEIRFLSPTDGQKVAGAVDVSVDCRLPFKYLALFIDGKFIAVSNRAPLSVQWDTRQWADGLHYLKAVAMGPAGPLAEASVQVIVQNAQHTLAAGEQAEDQRIGELLASLCIPVPDVVDVLVLRSRLAQRAGDAEAEVEEAEHAFWLAPHDAVARHRLQEVYLRCGIRPLELREIYGLNGRRAVAVTFDDGPHPAVTPWILRELARRGIKATFFLVGKQALCYPDLVQAIARAGHEIGVHGFSHRNMAIMGRAEAERELVRARWTIARACGKRPVLFRPPGGNYSPTLRAAAASTGFYTVFWTADNWKFRRLPLKQIVEKLQEELAAGGILLLHNGQDETPLILGQLLDSLARRGFRLGPLGELAGLKSIYLGLPIPGGGGR